MVDDVPRFERARAARQLAHLAGRGVWLGTSSWKYPGWRGTLYTDDRYLYRGRFAERRFEARCLAEYAEVFPTVGVDATYYRFPEPRTIEELAAQVPPAFHFSFKVTADITLKHFPVLPRFGPRAGQPNPRFLDAACLAESFLAPCRPIASRVGVLMFEFSRFQPADYARGRDFVAALDAFLGQLPTGWRYAVEIRNPTFLQPPYFEVLARHGVSHVCNSWQAMPPLDEQWNLVESLLPGECAVARLLLRPGREYAEAVRRFQPYRDIRDPYPEGRAAAIRLIREVLGGRGPNRAFLYVNNRFEGSALQTIAALLDAVVPEPPAPPP
jgi:uncharacterized protein YecE (DUF72 family)